MKYRKILLVEDDLRDEVLILRALRKAHIANHVEVVHDGAEALDYLFAMGDYAARSSTDLPAVVLLDLNMPKIGGLEVLRRLREAEATRTLPVVILTSSDDQQDMLTSYKLGANSYVRKPVAFAELGEAVAQLGLYWLVVNQLPSTGE